MSILATVTDNNFEHDMNCIEMVVVGDIENLTK